MNRSRARDTRGPRVLADRLAAVAASLVPQLGAETSAAAQARGAAMNDVHVIAFALEQIDGALGLPLPT